MKNSCAPAQEYRVVPAGKFKATCLQLMEEVNQKPLTIIMTKRGKPVAQMSAAPPDTRIIPPTVEMPESDEVLPIVKPIKPIDAETLEAGQKKNHHKKRKNKKKHK